MARDEIYDIMKQHSKEKFDADRMRFLADANHPDNNDGGWHKHTEFHWSRDVDGVKLNYWPSRKRWQYKGRVSRGMKGMYALINSHSKEQHVAEINPIYRSGSVTRWHAYPEVSAQSLADHHGRVAQIVLFFWPNCEASLLYAALHHDCGELITGDVPSPTKDANPALRVALSQAEVDARLSMGITSFVADFPMLRFADRLEAYTYVALHCHHLLGQPEWVRAIAELGEMADALGVSKRLTEWFAR